MALISQLLETLTPHRTEGTDAERRNSHYTTSSQAINLDGSAAETQTTAKQIPMPRAVLKEQREKRRAEALERYWRDPKGDWTLPRDIQARMMVQAGKKRSIILIFECLVSQAIVNENLIEMPPNKEFRNGYYKPFPPGTRPWSIRNIMAMTGYSINIVGAALKALEEWGLIRLTVTTRQKGWKFSKALNGGTIVEILNFEKYQRVKLLEKGLYQSVNPIDSLYGDILKDFRSLQPTRPKKIQTPVKKERVIDGYVIIHDEKLPVYRN
jgi:hypothetical protein